MLPVMYLVAPAKRIEDRNFESLLCFNDAFYVEKWRKEKEEREKRERKVLLLG
jgi:hypothetical protein